MLGFKQLICPVSSERIDENKVRVTAFGVIMIMGVFFITGNPVFSGLLMIDFFIRAFTKIKNSPIGWLAQLVVRLFGTDPVWINKAPKVFASRIGFLLTSAATLAALLGAQQFANIAGTVLVVFAFLECGLNFCAGCWVYTYVVFPLVRKNHG